MKFVHLHVHSYFSFEEGTPDILKLLERCKRLGMDAIALTDYDGLYGAIRLYKHARKLGMKPIIGTEITLSGNYQILLFAKNLDGYSHLCRLISSMHLSSKGRRPVCPLRLLRKYSQSLIALSAGSKGEIGVRIAKGQERLAEKALKKYVDIFGKENFYIEIQDHLLASEQQLNRRLLRFARNAGVGIVATNNVHFLEPGEYGLHKELVRTSRAVHHRTILPKPNKEFYLKSADEMCALFKEIPEAVENTLAIAEACNLYLELDKIRAPRLLTPKGEKAETSLEKACRNALHIPDHVKVISKLLCFYCFQFMA